MGGRLTREVEAEEGVVRRLDRDIAVGGGGAGLEGPGEGAGIGTGFGSALMALLEALGVRVVFSGTGVEVDPNSLAMREETSPLRGTDAAGEEM